MSEQLLVEAVQAVKALASPDYCTLWFNICMSRSEWAAWVQAIGSVFAIFVSSGLVWWQVNKQHKHSMLEASRHQLEEELRVLENFAQVGGYAVRNFVAAYDALRYGDEGAMSFFRARDVAVHDDLVAVSLNGADHSRMSSASLTLALLGVRKKFASCFDELNLARQALEAGNGSFRTVHRARLRDHTIELLANNDMLVRRAADIRKRLDMPLEPWHCETTSIPGNFTDHEER